MAGAIGKLTDKAIKAFITKAESKKSNANGQDNLAAACYFPVYEQVNNSLKGILVTVRPGVVIFT